MFGLFRHDESNVRGATIVPYQAGAVRGAGLRRPVIPLRALAKVRRHPSLGGHRVQHGLPDQIRGSWILVALLATAGVRPKRLATAVCRRAFRGRRGTGRTVRLDRCAIGWILTLACLTRLGRLANSKGAVRQGLLEFTRDYFHQFRWQYGQRFSVGSRGYRGRRCMRMSCHTPSVSEQFSAFSRRTAVFTYVANPYSAGNLRLTFVPVVFALLSAAVGFDFLTDRLASFAGIPHRRVAKVGTMAIVGTDRRVLCTGCDAFRQGGGQRARATSIVPGCSMVRRHSARPSPSGSPGYARCERAEQVRHCDLYGDSRRAHYWRHDRCAATGHHPCRGHPEDPSTFGNLPWRLPKRTTS